MKKNILSIFLALSLYSANAQEKYPVYCEISTFNNQTMGKCHVNIDMGEYACGVIIDENNKELEFGSLVDAANFMAKRGWRIINTYCMNVSPVAKCFVLEKQVSSDAETYDGLKLWYENKKARQQYESKIANK